MKRVGVRVMDRINELLQAEIEKAVKSDKDLAPGLAEIKYVVNKIFVEENLGLGGARQRG